MTRPPADAAGPDRLRLDAFGLALESAFPLPGAVPAPPRDGGNGVTTLRIAGADALEEAWPAARAERISERRTADGRVAFSIDADGRAGHLMRAEPFGSFLISGNAREIVCAPREVAPVAWQRYLFGHVLPLASAVRGHEIFHASAVVVGGRAFAFLGASTTGKTSTALNLVLRGAAFLTDDVLAVSLGPDGEVLAHPGIGVTSLRHDAAARLSPDERRRLGRPLERDGEAERIEIERHPVPVPLEAVYVLERGAPGDRVAVERVDRVDPRTLLSASFNFVIRTPDRLVRQLDVCARIASARAVRRAAIPEGCGPDAVAAAILAAESGALSG